MKQISKIFAILIIVSISVSAQSQVPSPRYGHTVCKVGQYYYIFGGTSIDGSKQSTKGSPLAELYQFDPTSSSFDKLNPTGDTPPGMTAHNAVEIEGKMFVLNGARTDIVNPSMYIFDPSTNNWGQRVSPPKKVKEAFLSFVGEYSLMYQAGGYDLETNAPTNKCYAFNPQTEQWTEKIPMQQGARYGGATAFLEGKLYCINGLNQYGPQSGAFVYDTQLDDWNTVPTTGFPPMWGTTTTQIGNNIYMWGGGMWSGKKSTKSDETVFSTDLYQLNIEAGTGNVVGVKKAENLPVSLYGAGWIDVANNDTIMYMFGGIQNITSTGDTVLINNLYRYNFTEEIVQQLDTTTNTWGGVITSINETEFKISEELTIYPNPASENVTINLQNNETIKTVKIFNQNGQLIRIIQNQTNNPIQISDLSSGLYFVRVDTNKKYYCGKIIKQ